MFSLSGNFRLFELTVGLSVYLRHRSWLTVFDDHTWGIDLDSPYLMIQLIRVLLYRATSNTSGLQTTSVNICCIDIDWSYSLTQTLMVWLPGKFKRFGLTADFSEHLKPRSWLTAYADSLEDGFTTEQLQAVWFDSWLQWTLAASIWIHCIR